MTSVVLCVLAVAPVPIAVVDVREVGDVAGKGAIVSEEIARSLPVEAFKVTTAAQLTTLLGIERQRQLLACDEGGSCSAELANALGAEVVVQTTLSAVDKGLRCSAVFVSGRDGAALERVTVDAQALGALLAKLHEDTEAAAARVFTKLRPGNSIAPGRAGFRSLAWIPAVVGVLLGVAAGAMFAVTDGTYRTLMSRDGRVTDPQALASSGRTTQTVGWSLGGVGAVALLAAGAMFAFGAPVPPRVTIAPVAGAGAAGLSVSVVLP